MAKSFLTHYKKGKKEHYTLVDLLSTEKNIIKVPKTKKCSVFGAVEEFLWGLKKLSGGHLKRGDIRFQVVDMAAAISDWASYLSSIDK